MKASNLMSRVAVRQPGGFTLVELLVVIGIIAVLISLLLPALGRVRGQAQTVACLSNLRSLGQAVAIYQAQQRSFPPLSQWSNGTFGSNRYRGFNVWGLLNVKAGQRIAVCPTVAAQIEAPTWSAANDPNRSLYSYRYNWLLSGAETNPIVAPNIPKAVIRDPVGPTYNANPVKRVKASSETLLFVDSPQIVAFQTNDQLGSDRGMDQAAVKPAGTVRSINGARVQSIRSIAPVHGNLKVSRFAPALSDGSIALSGLINVGYADGSVRTVEVTQGRFTPVADPASRIVLNDTTANGNIRAGNECVIEGTRLDPTIPP